MAEDLFITRTKLIVPQRRKELVTRNRLMDLLSNLLDYRLIIIAAPAGYGKTSLMIDFASQFEWPVCWYALEPLDADLQRFLTHFVHAIRVQFPDFCVEALTMLRSTSAEDINLEFLISMLTNEIFDDITEHFIIVLDDYHLLNTNAQIDRFLSDFIQRADDNCHITITSRKLLTLPDMPLMVARSQVGGLSIEELAFIQEEVQALYSQVFEQDISLPDAEEITGQSEGWITGLLLTSQMNKTGLGEPLKITRASGIGLYEYLAEQVLDQQPREVKEFLLHSSILEEFDSEMCRMVIGEALGVEQNWQNLMDKVVQNNLFILPVDDEFRWLRYHHLFRDFLQNRIRRTNLEAVEKIRLKLADYFQVKNDWDRVFEIYSSLGETDAIVKLIKNVGSSFIAKGKITKLSNWLEELPKEMVDIDPSLLSLQAAVTVNQGAVQHGRQILDRVIQMLETDGSQKMLVENLIRRSSALRVLGSYDAAVADSERAIDLSKNKKKLREDLSEAYRAKGAALYQMGKLKEGLGFLNKALQFCEVNLQGEDAARILVEIGAIQETLGEFQDAQQAYEKSLDYWQSIGDSIWISTILNNLGVLQHSSGDFVNSFHNLEKSMHYSQVTGNQRMEGYSLASIGDLYKDMDASEEAADAYQKSLEISQRIGDHFLILYLKTARARLDSMNKDFSKAERQIQAASAIAKKSGSPYEVNKCLLEKSALELARGKFKSALKSLSLAENFFSKQGHIEEYMRGKVIRFLSSAKLNKSKDQKELAVELLIDIENPSSNLPCMVAINEFQAIFKSLTQRKEISDEISKILKQLSDFQKSTQNNRRNIRKHASVVPFAPAHIKITAFNKAEVEVKNKPLAISDWKTQTSRDLFFLFLAYPEGLTKEEVGIVFWPDSTDAELKLRFKNAMYRMRHAIGSETVLFQDGYYQFNRSIDYEYDVQNFLTAIENARTTKNDGEKIKVLMMAVDRYKGVYLSEIDEVWAVADRQRYLNHFMNAIEELLSLLMDKKEFESVLSYSEKALTQDPCNEKIHRLVMNVHALLGNKSAVSRQYKTCILILTKELGTEPSSQTRKLYNSLMA